jgi:hypothetical protein
MRQRVPILVSMTSAALLSIAGLTASARAATQAPAQAEVPNSGVAVLGDGQRPTVTALGLSSAYANSAFSGGADNNSVQVVADSPPSFGRFQLITQQTTQQPAQPIRHLSLDMPASGISNYRCNYGPEDPSKASSKNYARLGAQLSILGGKAQLLCYQRNASTGAYTGYQIYTGTTCVTITGGPHYVIDGRGCEADVYQLNKNKLREIGSDQPFSIYLEADSA